MLKSDDFKANCQFSSRKIIKNQEKKKIKKMLLTIDCFCKFSIDAFNDNSERFWNRF